MKQTSQDKIQQLKDKVFMVTDWILDHRKIVMPGVLIVCVLITVLIAIHANKKEALEKAAEAAAEAAQEQEGTENAAPEYELEENAYPEVNNVVRTYYDAQASGDMETISKLNTYLNDIEKIRVEELSKYIESYPVLNVYTKPGLTENSYVTYVCSEVKFYDAEQTIAGMQTYYIAQDENGDFFINDGTYNDEIYNYIKEVTLQDDVVDLNNKVVVAYNDLLAENEELNEFVAYLKEKINEEVGEILAKIEQPEEEEQQEEEEPQEEVVTQTTILAKATDVVNIRTSDSEQAEKVGKAQLGEEFTVLEQRENGWSRISYEGNDAFIKSDYLEVISEETQDVERADSDEDAETSDQDETDQTTNAATTGKSAGEKVTAKESVRIRKSASTDADILGNAYRGDTFELVMEQADGWSKVKYKGKDAYIKTEFLE